MRRTLTGTLGFLITIAVSACAGPHHPEPAAEASAPLQSSEVASYFVVLPGVAAVKRIPKGANLKSEKVQQATRARLSEIQAEQAALEPELVGAGAVVIARLTNLVNAVQVVCNAETAARIETLPGVLRVERVPLVERALASAVPVIGAPALWTSVPGILGDGVTVGIIDSGIDYTHADFGGTGQSADYLANDPEVIEPNSFPTTKVVGGWDFAGDAYNPSGGVPTPNSDPDPLDCTTVIGEDISGGHGTHVAGIVAGIGVAQDGSTFAGPYAASIDPSAFRVAPGVAPHASLYALKIFGCQGSTTLLGAALDRAADPDKDGSFDDRLDIINGSLGSSYGLGTAAVGEAVKELTDLGSLIVAAAGNEGGSFFVVSSPSTYPEVLSVAASSDAPLVPLTVTSPDSASATYPSTQAVFTKYLDAPITGELVLANPPLACAPLTNAAEISGKIALIDRGTCAFSDKHQEAVNAGAAAVVVVDNQAADLPFTMAGAPPGTIPIPGVMVTLDDGAQLKAALTTGPVAIQIDSKPYTGPGAETLAPFSARGPSGLDGRFKPEISAPGLGIDSAGVSTGTEPLNNSGTSMASPMVSGAAALVRQARPELSAYDLKSVLINSGVPLATAESVNYATSQIGGGRVDVARAAQSILSAAANPLTGEVGVSFGNVVAAEPTAVSRSFVLKNHGTSPIVFTGQLVPTHSLPGVTLQVNAPDMPIAPGETGTVVLDLQVDPVAFGAPGPDPTTPAVQGMMSPTPRHYLNEVSGFVVLTPEGQPSNPIAIPYQGSVRAAASRKAVAPVICAASQALPEGSVNLELEGTSAHPNPVVTAFQLAVLDEAKDDDDPVTKMTDIRAVGIATDIATAPSFDEANVYFGIAVEGDWTTPARGPVSLVKVEINTDNVGFAEFELRVEARNKDRRFRDSLVTRVYNTQTGEAINRHPINIATPDVLPTYPFYNSVVVLSAPLSEIGVTPESPNFGWAVSTERPDLVLQTEKVKGTFDPTQPLLNTAIHGQNGTPLFTGPGPIQVDVTPFGAALGTPLDVLLLHHTNGSALRYEVVNLGPTPTANLTAAINSATTLVEGQAGELTYQVTNNGATAAANVVLTGLVDGGEVTGILPAQGTCSGDANFECTLGDLPAGASVTIAVTLIPESGSITANGAVTGDVPCEPSVDDNSAAITVGVAPIDEVDEDVVPAGGCACKTAPEPSLPSHFKWLAAAGMAALLGARRRNRR
ncbi:MAG: S8 family serine peptidase [Polyangiaceae bacterium]|nr:S8 family serine peptidase [Polyangiaceae bacterium]